ncbi:MAG: hypothetical protein IPG45_23565 [Deltaproteobacteria bacterium]|jgi:hypothetical protein|nr:hypothetical protein [Deltaproteobacteria bacterium]
MMWWPLLLLGAPEVVALHLEEVGELPPQEARSLLSPLASLVETHTAGRARWVEAFDLRCDARPCGAEILSQGGATRGLSIRVFGGPRRIHLRFELLPDGRVAEANVARDRSDLQVQLQTLIETLLPAAPPAPPELVPPPIVAAPRAGPPILPLVLAGGALVVAGVGVGFGLSSEGAGEELAAGPLPAGAHQNLVDRQDQQALAANLCFAVAGTAVAAALITWLLDP